MAAIVTSEYRTRQIVRPNICINLRGRKPNNKPEIIAEINNPVPVADNQFTTKIASSAFACATTGGVRNT